MMYGNTIIAEGGNTIIAEGQGLTSRRKLRLTSWQMHGTCKPTWTL